MEKGDGRRNGIGRDWWRLVEKVDWKRKEIGGFRRSEEKGDW